METLLSGLLKEAEYVSDVRNAYAIIKLVEK